MDYVAEQEMEIEALEAILMDDLEVYSGTIPDGWNAEKLYRVKIYPSEEEEQKLDRRIVLDFLFCHTENYPDEAPNFRLHSSAGLSDEDVAQVYSLVENEVEANQGMAMMFNLIEVAREWLREKVNAGTFSKVSQEEDKKAKQEAEERRILEQRSHGTPVTVDTFMRWKEKFEAEMKALAAKEHKGRIDEHNQRQTGKEFFQTHDEKDAEERDEDDEEDEDDEDEDEIEEVEEELNYEDDDDEGMADDYLSQAN